MTEGESNTHLISLEVAIARAKEKKIIEETKGEEAFIAIPTFYCEDRHCNIYGDKKRKICLEKEECDFKFSCFLKYV